MPKALQVAAKNWRTSLAGCATALMAILDMVVKLCDSNPATVPDYALVVATLTAAIGLVFARDVSVTSKDLGLDQ